MNMGESMGWWIMGTKHLMPRQDSRAKWMKRDDSRANSAAAHSNKLVQVVNWDVQIARLKNMLREIYGR